MTQDTTPASLRRDAQLMREVAGGDARAFHEIVRLHLRGIVGLAFRFLGSREEAEEVAQETFVRLWQTAASYEPRAKLSTYLHTMTHHLAVDHLRRRRESDGARDLDELPASGRPSSLLVQKQVAQSVQRALDALPPRQKEAIVLVHFQGLSQAEAADMMGVGVEALESLLARARRELRRALGPLVEADGDDAPSTGAER